MTPREQPQRPHSDRAESQDASESRRWCCPNCGQMIFTFAGERLPDLCDYCGDMTTWRQVDGGEDEPG